MEKSTYINKVFFLVKMISQTFWFIVLPCCLKKLKESIQKKRETGVLYNDKITCITFEDFYHFGFSDAAIFFN